MVAELKSKPEFPWDCNILLVFVCRLPVMSLLGMESGGTALTDKCFFIGVDVTGEVMSIICDDLCFFHPSPSICDTTVFAVTKRRRKF